jgi:hypothetical protein
MPLVGGDGLMIHNIYALRLYISLRGPCCCLQHYYLPRWSSFFRTGEERAPGLGPRPRALLPYAVSAAPKLSAGCCVTGATP